MLDWQWRPPPASQPGAPAQPRRASTVRRGRFALRTARDLDALNPAEAEGTSRAEACVGHGSPLVVGRSPESVALRSGAAKDAAQLRARVRPEEREREREKGRPRRRRGGHGGGGEPTIAQAAEAWTAAMAK